MRSNILLINTQHYRKYDSAQFTFDKDIYIMLILKIVQQTL